MKNAAIGLIFVLTGTALRAQEPQNQDTCAVSGVVVKSTTGAPLKRAIVYLQHIGTTASNEQYSLRTDVGGRFSFSGLRPGDYSMWVNRDGYLNMSYGQDKPQSPPKPLTLRPGERRTDLLFRLVPLGDIVGHVYDEDGEPVSGVNIQALQYNYVNGHRQLLPTGTTSSDDVGAYRLARLTPGEYYIGATYNDPAPPSDQATPVAYVPVYYPGATDPAAAQPIRVGTGQELPDVDFTLVPVRSVSIRGRLICTTDRILPGLNVGLLRRDVGMFSYQGNSMVDSQGNFEIRSVPPGSYVLSVQYYDRGRQYSGRQTVDVGNSDVDGVELVLGPGSEVKGVVRIEGKGLSPKGLQVQLVPREQVQMGAQPSNVEANGSFAFQHVPDGPYLVNLCCLPPNFYLKAARLGSEDALANGVNLNQTQPAGSLDLIVSSAGGQIEGVVVSEEKPASFGLVVLVPDSSVRGQSSPYPATGLAGDGRFTLTSIPPGEYSLFALERADNSAYMDPEFLHTYETYGKPVRIEEGSKLTVQLELIHSKDSGP